MGPYNTLEAFRSLKNISSEEGIIPTMSQRHLATSTPLEAYSLLNIVLVKTLAA